MATVHELITAAQFEEMTFDVPVELVRGEIVEMSPPLPIHGRTCFRVAYVIGRWIESQNTVDGEICTNDTAVVTERDPDTVRGADAFFVARNRLPGGKLPTTYTDLVPNLCVEVLSPSDRWRDVHRKIDEYLARGVTSVWVVDPARRTVQVFRTDEPPATFAEADELQDEPALPGFACPVADLFAGL